LIGTQGKPQEIGGYYQPNSELTSKAMRPDLTLFLLKYLNNLPYYCFKRQPEMVVFYFF
jgi:hypothetical protein